MNFANLLKSGWLHALFMGFIAYPLGAMRQKIAASNDDINILVYTGLCMLCASWFLLFRSKDGKLTMTSLRLPHTWIYGLLETITISLGVFIMVYISATETAALSRTTAIFTFLLSLFFLKQSTEKYELIGFVVMIIGFIYTSYLIDLPIILKATLIVLIILKNFLQASKKVTIELHKANQESLTSKDRMRVTGIVMAITSMIFMFVLFVVALFQSLYGFKINEYTPMITDFANIKMFLLAVIGGGFILSLNKYLEFFVGKTLGAKYLMTMASLQIVGLYIIERLISLTGIIEMKEFSNQTFIALGIILLGNLIISLSGFIKDLSFIKKGEEVDRLSQLEDNFIDDEDDFNTVKLNTYNLLNLYYNDKELLSKDLKTSIQDIDNIIYSNFDDVDISKKLEYKINKFASKHVSITDKLTKAYNRYYLEHKSYELFKENIGFKLYYLDLNKFKPINDNYGHDAGDYVLAQTVLRLKDINHFENNVYRIGGDEFILVQTDNLSEDLSDSILKAIEEPIGFKDLVINISTSIGISKSIDFDCLEEMIDSADKMMFNNKESR